MSTALSLPFFVSVEGQAYSNHRNPKGIYQIEVLKEKTVAHSAYAAIQVAKDSVPFLSENLDTCVIRVFRDDGCEVEIPRPLTTVHEHLGCFIGRAKDAPDTITVQ